MFGERCEGLPKPIGPSFVKCSNGFPGTIGLPLAINATSRGLAGVRGVRADLRGDQALK